MSERAEVLVVGAGLGGLALARDLADAGQRVTVLDRGRGVSGRSSTRRLRVGEQEATLDHGARYFTARHERTEALVRRGLEAGWLAEWTRSVPKLEWRGAEGGEIIREEGGHPRYVPPAGMNVIGHELARGLDARTGVTVTRLERTADGWTAHADDGQTWQAGRMVLNMPAHQLLPLLDGAELGGAELGGAELGGAGLDTSALEAVRFDTCWAVGAVLAADVPGADWPALSVKGHGVLEWICREHTKRQLDPQLAGHPPALMLHARADWSRAHLGDPPEANEAALLLAARELLGPLSVERSFIHRWKSATPTERYPQGFGWVPELELGWCGDWCTPDGHGPRVEAALMSGWGLAEQLL